MKAIRNSPPSERLQKKRKWTFATCQTSPSPFVKSLPNSSANDAANCAESPRKRQFVEILVKPPNSQNDSRDLSQRSPLSSALRANEAEQEILFQANAERIVGNMLRPPPFLQRTKTPLPAFKSSSASSEKETKTPPTAARQKSACCLGPCEREKLAGRSFCAYHKKRKREFGIDKLYDVEKRANERKYLDKVVSRLYAAGRRNVLSKASFSNELVPMCLVGDCKRGLYAKNMCQKHYRRALRIVRKKQVDAATSECHEK